MARKPWHLCRWCYHFVKDICYYDPKAEDVNPGDPGCNFWACYHCGEDWEVDHTACFTIPTPVSETGQSDNLCNCGQPLQQCQHKPTLQHSNPESFHGRSGESPPSPLE